MSEKERLEFGNPKHIKLASIGYRMAEAVKYKLKGELVTVEEECDNCDGTGVIEEFECSYCGNSGWSRDMVVYAKAPIIEGERRDELVGRCIKCFAKLKK